MTNTKHTVQGLMYDLRELAEAKKTNAKMRVIIPIERAIPCRADDALNAAQRFIADSLPLWDRDAVYAAVETLVHARHLVSTQTEGR